jgi:cell division protein FtsW (lipid II flippase)
MAEEAGLLVIFSLVILFFFVMVQVYIIARAFSEVRIPSKLYLALR